MPLSSRWPVVLEATTYTKIYRAAVMGRVLVCSRELTNAADRYAIAVTEEETIIGHLPRKISKVYSLFL